MSKGKPKGEVDAIKKELMDSMANEAIYPALHRSINNFDPTHIKAGDVSPVKFSTYLWKNLITEHRKNFGRVANELYAGTYTSPNDSYYDDINVRKAAERLLAERHSHLEDAPEFEMQDLSEWAANAHTELKEFEHILKEKADENVKAGVWKPQDIELMKDSMKEAKKDLGEAVKSPTPIAAVNDFLSKWEDQSRGLEGVFSAPQSNADDIIDHVESLTNQKPRTSKELGSTYGARVGWKLDPADPELAWLKVDPHLRRRVTEEKLKTVGDLLRSVDKHPFVGPGEAATRNSYEFEMNRLLGKSPYKTVMKAQIEEEDQNMAPPVNYVDRAGEPGAFQYLYEQGPGGNIVQGTNAPADHEHHVESLGEPVAHQSEPTVEGNPNLFDSQGRKLFSPIPLDAENIEENPNYDPDKTSGNHWAMRYQDAESGNTRHSYLHRDQVTDPKMQRNNAIKYLDSQLPKIRRWYLELLSSEQKEDQAVGLFFALMDQAKLAAKDMLDTMTVEQVSLEGNTATFTTMNGEVKAVLDERTAAVLKELLEGKETDDYVFEADGRPIDYRVVNKLMQDNFGVLPSAVQAYHYTKLFSKEFQELVNEESTEFTLNHLEDLRHEATKEVAKKVGSDPFQVAKLVDPIVVESLLLAASVKRHNLGKSRGWCNICKEPFGHCPHTRQKNKLSKGYKLQGKTEFQGLPVSIENKKGSVRKWYDPNAKEHGETKMNYDYGYIRGTMGVDKDHVDCYLGSNPEAKRVYIVHQMKKPDFSKFDEDKCFLGFDSAEEAKAAYLKQYDDPRFFGSMSAVPIEKFKEKVKATKDHPQMIKSHTWSVLSTHPDKTEEEEGFSKWLHEYPLHEHHVHWDAIERQANKNKQQESEQTLGISIGTKPVLEESAA
jgi:hypothetical protein